MSVQSDSHSEREAIAQICMEFTVPEHTCAQVKPKSNIHGVYMASLGCSNWHCGRRLYEHRVAVLTLAWDLAS